ncbi:MAG: DNA alkylation repair protein [Clostridiales bacterium]|nr:DNA alkylation repair protein [Candidatus Equinaster intestinalis]
MTDYIKKRLFEMQDLTYHDFQAKLMPNVDKERIIGVRTPLLRSFAKELAKNEKIDEFLNDIPHKYYDENNLHGFIISQCKDYEKTVKYVDALLPFVDNWATCDLLSPAVFKKHKTELEREIDRWIKSDKTYTVRFGIEMIMSHYLDADFDKKWLDKVSVLRSEEYYVNMMIAWFFATALTKQWESALPYIENKKLDKWCHNKAIQKANESYRITPEQKAHLKTLKI